MKNKLILLGCGVIVIAAGAAVYFYRYRPPEGYSQKTDVSDLIHPMSPKSNEVIRSPLRITGEARGYWFFEASFPVKLLDADGKQLAAVPAQAKSEWMTEDFVPYEAVLEFVPPVSNRGFLVLKNDNPSDIRENDRELWIPVLFR